MHIKQHKWIAIVLTVLLTLTLMSGCGKKDSSGGGPDKTALSSSEAFAVGLRDVLIESSVQGDKLGSLQLDMFFNPTAQLDTNRSNSTSVIINAQNANEPENNLLITSESLLNAKSGDASFTIAMGQGQEQAQAGGVYFLGDNMLIKRPSAENKMVSHSLSPEQTSTLKNASAMERMGRVLGTESADLEAADGWKSAVDAYISIISQNTEEADYSTGKVDVPLLKGQEKCDSIVLNLKGAKGQTVSLELVQLLQKNSAANGMFEDAGASDNSEFSGLELVQSTLEGLKAEELAALELSLTTFDFDNQSIGFDMQVKTGGKTFKLKEIFYSKNYEHHNETALTMFDGSKAVFIDKNVSAGGDKYQGDISFVNTLADGTELSAVKAQSSSVNNDKKYSTDLTFSFSSSSDDPDDIEVNTSDGTFSWSQTKSGSGDISGSGRGQVDIASDEETNRLTFDVSLEQKYADVKIARPQFLESAGIMTANQDELLAALDVDQDEFLDQNAISRTMQGLILLTY